MTNRALSPSIIELDEVASTNSWLARHPDRGRLPHGTTVTARSQTAGRGQRGNTWEAAAGLNVTMSMLLRPSTISARDQFLISEAVSVAIAGVCRELLGDFGEAVAIKWPNDIYVGDRKICGILIEHTLSGSRIDSTVAGIGLNVNQERFLSDAPNPVSLRQLTGRSCDVGDVARRVARAVTAMMETYDNPGEYGRLHEQYLSVLWRFGRLSPYLDTVTGERFEAAIADVAPDGIISLREADGRVHRYAFKEVAFLLS